MAHFGTKSQPFAHEAKEWLTKYVQGRQVRIQLHRIDQYGRAVATVWVHRRSLIPFLWPLWYNVSLEMVRSGYATIYRDTGAEYGGILADLEAAEIRARKSKLGMWTQSPLQYQSPSDFKRQNRLQSAMKNAENSYSSSEKSPSFIKMRKIGIDFVSEPNRLKTASAFGRGA